MAGTYGLKAFKKTISVLNTAEPLSTATTALLGRFARNLTLLAAPANSATVYLGSSTVDASNGFPLIAGASISVGDVQKLGTGKEYDLTAIYVYGAATNIVHVIHDQEIVS